MAVIGKRLDNGPQLLAELHRLPELLDDTQTIELRKQLAMQQNSLERLHDQVQDQQRLSRRRGLLLLVAAALSGAVWLASGA